MNLSEGIEKYNISFVYCENGYQIKITVPSNITSIELVEEFTKFMKMIGYQDESIDKAYKTRSKDSTSKVLQENIQNGKVTNLNSYLSSKYNK